jgi:hypothetical protein
VSATLPRMPRALGLLLLATIGCGPGEVPPFGEGETAGTETGDGDPGELAFDLEEHGGETGGAGGGSAEPEHAASGPVVCFEPGNPGAECWIAWTGESCAADEANACELGVRVCTEPAGLCVLAGPDGCPPGWIDACE